MRFVWAEINLAAIAHNIREIKKVLQPTTKMLGIVKADAYGHGAASVSEILLKEGVAYLGVAMLSEALELRCQGICAPILILGYTAPDDLSQMIDNNVAQTIFSLEQAKQLDAAAIAKKRRVKIHLKLDTGMGRLGFCLNENSFEQIIEISQMQGLLVEGIYSHLADSDSNNSAYTLGQKKIFETFMGRLKVAGVEPEICHLANSAAALQYPELHYDMVRLGLVMYGYYPTGSADFKSLGLNLIPAMALKARIAHLKMVEPGMKVSYGCTYTTFKQTLIATLPLGYADGYSRQLSNGSDVLIRGKRVPIIGRVCMDQCMVDVTNLPDVALGDEAVLMGFQGDDLISADELAKLTNTINHEILCMVSHRVPRVYI
ncbi:MAG: alanine racemase [Clostridia bacterium]